MILGSLLVSTLTAGFGRTIDISPEEQKVLVTLCLIKTAAEEIISEGRDWYW